MESLAFYKSLAEAVGFTVDEHGQFFLSELGVFKPMTISGKQIWLPTLELLKQPPSAERLLFHPACESAVRKESIVVKKLREAMSLRINRITHTLMVALADFAVDSAKSSTLSPAQKLYMSELAKVGTCDGKFYTDVVSVMGKVAPKAHQLVSMWVSANGILPGTDGKAKQFRRVANVIFPLLDDRQHNDPTLFGQKLQRKGNKETILTLFKYIFPNAEVKGRYSYGTNDITAANFISLCYAYAGICERLNELVTLFAEPLQTFGYAEDFPLLTELDWVDGLTEIPRYRAEIPEQEGNVGDPVDSGETAGGATMTIPAVPAAVAPTPTATAAPTTQAPKASQMSSALAALKAANSKGAKAPQQVPNQNLQVTAPAPVAPQLKSWDQYAAERAPAPLQPQQYGVQPQYYAPQAQVPAVVAIPPQQQYQPVQQQYAAVPPQGYYNPQQNAAPMLQHSYPNVPAGSSPARAAMIQKQQQLYQQQYYQNAPQQYQPIQQQYAPAPQLAPPPAGYQYVQSGNQFVLQPIQQGSYYAPQGYAQPQIPVGVPV